MSLLSFERVSKRFNGIVAVDDVTFTVDRGQVVGFLGPNGAGKSTTMRMITQYFEPDAGQIRLDDVPLTDAGRQAKERIGFLPESNPLYTEMLVSEYLDFVARLRGLAGAERTRTIDEAVSATGLDSVFHRPIGELSKGFRQRIGLAAAILHRPDLLILDEPTEGLDPNQRVEIRRLIAELGRERTVMLSTHVLSEVQSMCSRLLIINRGKVVADGTVDSLVSRANAGVRVSVEAAGDDVEKRLAALAGVCGVERHEDGANGRVRLSLTATGDDDVRPGIFGLAKEHGWTLFELHQETGSLEDLFRELTATEEAAA
ncbi:MAG TPA: ATP-binding cassette domain-containing protein [Gemmatimonadaceae bacterium]|nr:ATP-binding cassette domain-containing protein [Gemmatimonadaceae bacterium]